MLDDLLDAGVRDGRGLGDVVDGATLGHGVEEWLSGHDG